MKLVILSLFVVGAIGCGSGGATVDASGGLDSGHAADGPAVVEKDVGAVADTPIGNIGESDGAVDAGVAGGAVDVGVAGDTAGSGGSDGASGASAASGASCASLPATCGPAGNESCCTSLLVPGGTFYRNDDYNHPATLSDFYLDKYEITVGRFRAFVNAGMGTRASPPAANAGAHPRIAGSGWDPAWNVSLPVDTVALQAAIAPTLFPSDWTTWTSVPGGNESRPQNSLNWYLAFAFCAWDGGRLPTDAELNYAGVGGDEQRKYPWGSADPNYTMASYDCMGDGIAGCSLADFVFVGTKPAGNGRWGHADLSGNVWEWVLDCLGEAPMPCNDCANLRDPTSRLNRGGGLDNPDTYLSSAYNGSDMHPDESTPEVGARCARGKP